MLGYIRIIFIPGRMNVFYSQPRIKIETGNLRNVQLI